MSTQLIDPYNSPEYMAFKQQMSERQHELRIEAQKRADQAYNQGLWESLPFWKKHLYYVLRRQPRTVQNARMVK